MVEFSADCATLRAKSRAGGYSEAVDSWGTGVYAFYTPVNGLSIRRRSSERNRRLPRNPKSLRARKMKAAYRSAVKDGKGAAQVDGFLVDAATMRLFGKVLEMADRIGM